MKICGIYKIQSRIKLKRCYIGSAVNINNRWETHLRDLKKNKHHSINLQRHFNKYGKNDLIFSILIGCPKEDLIVTEQFYIDAYNPYFNICKIAGNCLGIKQSKKTCKKKSEASRGRKLSEEHKKKMSEALKGHKLSEETKKKIGEANKGMKRSEETKHKMNQNRKGMTGKHHSTETKQKLSEAFKGKKRLPFSEETKKKISESGKKGWINRKLKIA